MTTAEQNAEAIGEIMVYMPEDRIEDAKDLIRRARTELVLWPEFTDDIVADLLRALTALRDTADVWGAG